jgi:hypothetical protein
MNSSQRKLLALPCVNIHFLQKERHTKLEIINIEINFFPYLGEFQNGMYQPLLEIASENHIIRWIVLPQRLEMATANTGVEGILGTDRIDKLVVTFDLRKSCPELELYQD